MEYMEVMIEDMKNMIVEAMRNQMARGWSLERVEGMFIVSARRALDEIEGRKQ